VTQLAGEGITLKDRIGGVNRAETSTKLADYEIKNYGFTDTQANIASGYAFGDGADALGGAAFSGENKTPLLITKNVTQADELATWLARNANTVAGGNVFGGAGAVADALVASLQSAARGITSNQALTVTPTEAVTQSVDGTDTPAANKTVDDRQYSVSGLDTSKAYTVALVDAANVTTDNGGQVSFADKAGAANEADGVGATASAHLSVVNGTPQTADSVTVAAGTSSISFTVEGDAAGAVVPVVFQDANGNGALDLVAPATANNDPKKPSEAFGVGGKITYTAGEAALGSSTPVVASVNSASDYFQSATARYDYDSNDVFQYQGVGITMAQFEGMLSPTDALAVSYNPDAAGVSTFNVTTDNVATPGTPSAVVKSVDGGSTLNDVVVTFTPSPDAAAETYQLLSGTYGNGVDGVPGGGDDVAPAGYTAVSGAAQSTDADGNIVFTLKNVADGGYGYEVKATGPVSGATKTSAASTEVIVPGTPDGTKPKSTLATQTTSAGLGNTVDAGDVFKIVFDEPIATPAAGAVIRANDGADGTVADIINGTNATFSLNTASETVGGTARAAGTVLTVTITGAPSTVAAGTTTGLQLPATVIDASNIKDVSGNTWDVAGSGDKVLN